MTSNEDEINDKSSKGNWNEYTLGNITKIIGGGTPSTKVPSYWNGNIPWITPKDLSIQKSKYIEFGGRNITKNGLINSNANLIPPNSIILSTRAPIGYIAIARRELTTNQGCHTLLPSDNFDSEFLYYLLKKNVEFLKSQSNGSTFGELSSKTLKEIKFLFPPLKEQKAIAKILSDLDSKIEHNKKMNKTLETIAQAIFKHWFIDFEFPNEEGKPYKSSGGQMVDSELGEIPKGWEVKSVADVTDIIRGVSYRSDQLVPSENALVTLKSILRGGGFTKNGFKSYSGDYKINQRLNPHDVIMAFTDLTQQGDVIGRLALVEDTAEYKNIMASMDIGIIRFKENFPYKFFIYQLMKSDSFHTHVLAYVNGTTVLHLSKEGPRSYKFSSPEIGCLIRFENLMPFFYDKIRNNSKQMEFLKLIKDLLLPKLMSGKIRISLED